MNGLFYEIWNVIAPKSLVGHSINLNYSASFFKISINQYIYGFIAILFIIYLLRSKMEERPFKEALKVASVKAFSALLVSWSFLAIITHITFVGYFRGTLTLTFRFIFAICILLFLGWLTVSFLYRSYDDKKMMRMGLGGIVVSRRISLIELFGLSWLIGLGWLILAACLLSYAKIPFHFWSFTIAFGFMATILYELLVLFDLKLNIPVMPKFPKTNLFAWGVSLVIAYVLFFSVYTPLWACDSKLRYSKYSRSIYMSRKLSKRNLNKDLILGPLSQAYIYTMVGKEDRHLGKIAFPLCYVSLIFVFYCGLRRKLTQYSALFWTYLLTSFSLPLLHAITAYNDMPMACFYGAGMIKLYEYWDK